MGKFTVKHVVIIVGVYFVAAWLWNEYGPEGTPDAPLDLIGTLTG